MTSIASPALHTLSLAATAMDTVWVRQPTAGGFERFTAFASGALILAALVAVVALVPVVLSLRRRYLRVEALLQKANEDLRPLLGHAHAIADNLTYITTAIREDVGTISTTLRSANDRLQEAIASTERQMHDFNALLAVVQQEAEGVFVATAATVRGVRTGASHFAGGGGTELASVESDDDDLEVVGDDEDTDNGNDGYTDDDPDTARGPRVVRRSRSAR